MALEMKDNGALGCAYYSAADSGLYLLEDVPSASIDMVESLVIHVQPSSVFVPSRATAELVEYLEKHTRVNSHGVYYFPLLLPNANLAVPSRGYCIVCYQGRPLRELCV